MDPSLLSLLLDYSNPQSPTKDSLGDIVVEVLTSKEIPEGTKGMIMDLISESPQYLKPAIVALGDSFHFESWETRLSLRILQHKLGIRDALHEIRDILIKWKAGKNRTPDDEISFAIEGLRRIGKVEDIPLLVACRGVAGLSDNKVKTALAGIGYRYYLPGTCLQWQLQAGNLSENLPYLALVATGRVYDFVLRREQVRPDGLDWPEFAMPPLPGSYLQFLRREAGLLASLITSDSVAVRTLACESILMLHLPKAEVMKLLNPMIAIWENQASLEEAESHSIALYRAWVKYT